MDLSRAFSQWFGRVGSNSLIVRRVRMFLCTSRDCACGLAWSWLKHCLVMMVVVVCVVNALAAISSWAAATSMYIIDLIFSG